MGGSRGRLEHAGTSRRRRRTTRSADSGPRPPILGTRAGNPAPPLVATHGQVWWYHVAMSDGSEAQVGIRELKDNASAVIRRVAAGETIRITDRGRTVARIVPLRDDDDWWARMADAGR